MEKSQIRAKYVLFSIAITVLSIVFNITSNKIKTHTLKPGKSFVLSFGEDLSIGDYYLEYYITSSSSDSAIYAMEFSLKSTDVDGNEVLFDKQCYSKAIGYGSSGFRINNAGDIVTAEFKRTETEGLFANLSTSAGIGNIFVSSKDGTYRQIVYAPPSIGKQAELSERESNLLSNVQVSDFAILKNYYMDDNALNITFVCTAEIPDKYELGIELTCNNINALPSSGVRQSFYGLVPDTDTWIIGEEYAQQINLGLPPGTYWLDMVLSPISPDTPRGISNYILTDNRNKISLGSINILGQYLSDYLRNICDGQIVIISVMDEGTRMLNEVSYSALSELGLKSDLSGKNRWSYIGIAAKGIDGFEAMESLSQQLIEINLSKGSLLGTFELPFDLNVISAGYTVGNTSSIRINQNEYSKKKRGMNISIYDTDKKEVVSSVNFDTYLASYNYSQMQIKQ